MSDPNPIQAYAPTSNGTVDIRTVDIRAARSLDASERQAHLTKVGDCARRSFAVAILGDAGKNVAVGSFSLDEKVTYDSAWSVHIAANTER